MLNFLFGDHGYMPHIHCYLGEPSLVWTMVTTDTLIGLAYISISLTLWGLIRKIQIPFNLIIVCFGLFIGACGATHFMEVWTLWHPDYWIAAAIKVVTAAASVGTGVYLFRLRHVLYNFAEAARLAEQRKSELERSATDLETRFRERTRELETVGSRLMRISSATNLGVWYCDLPFDKLNWSKKTKEHFWLNEDAEVTTEIFYQHIHPEDRERIRLAIEHSIESKNAYDIECRTINPANCHLWKWIRTVGWTTYDSLEKPLSFDGITIDLTEKKTEQDRTKVAIENERENFRNLFRQTPEMVCILSGPEHIFEFVNEAHIKVLGFDATGKKVREAQPESVEVHGILDDVYQTGMTAELHEIPITVTDRLRFFNLTYAARRSAFGQINGIMILGIEVTGDVENRERISIAQNQLKQALSGAKMGTYSIDLKTQNATLSDESFAILDIKKIGDGNIHPLIADYILPEDQKIGEDMIIQAVETKETVQAEYRIVRPSGDIRWIFSQGKIQCAEDGTPLTFSGVILDTTERKQLELDLEKSKARAEEDRNSAERANDAKTNFLANMSHEIRTPIGAITGFAEMLNKGGYSDSDKKNFTMVIQRNSLHLLRLIDDILDLSKVESGKIAFENSNFSLSEFLLDFDAVMSLKAAEKGIEFVIKVNKTIPDEVFGDQLRLKQIFSNIIGNALKFTNKGHVTADVAYESSVLTCIVTDTGLGIAEESVKNLFKPFTQADPSLTRKFGGTGLGLILSKRLANQLGGDVILESSEPGKGSRFVINVQLTQCANSKMIEYAGAAPVEVAVHTAPAEAGVLKELTVLLVEDSPDNRMLISTYLKNTGAKVLLAKDGQEGYLRAMRNLPDIVLMDIQMPRMDGHEATKKLREAGFKNPIIALTAHAMKEERDRCFESGCSDYLTKPLHRDRLIEALLKNSREPAERVGC